mgnify:CR=1 FL=1
MLVRDKTLMAELMKETVYYAADFLPAVQSMLEERTGVNRGWRDTGNSWSCSECMTAKPAKMYSPCFGSNFSNSTSGGGIPGGTTHQRLALADNQSGSAT